MPPKRKAAASTENEPAQTRRKTRSTVAVSEDSTAATQAAAPPAKRVRRVAKAKEEPVVLQADEPAHFNAPPAAKPSSRTTRATTRTRKVVAKPEEEQEAGPSVPKKRVRPSKKTQPLVEEVSVHEEPEPVRRPPSPTPEEVTPTIPKKRGRQKKETDYPVDAPLPQPAVPTEAPRPTRARRTKAVPGEVVVAKRESTRTQRNLAQVPSKTRGRPKKGPSPVRRPATPPPPDDESSDDELLLTPSKRNSTRMTTPPLTGGTRLGTPRMVMHSVEITTPRRLLHTVRRDLGSPAPRVHVPPLGTPKLPPAFPSASPQKRAAPPSAARPRAPRSPSPEQSLALTGSPRKQQLQLAAQHARDLPKVLPPHLHPFLDLQKRAILKALQRPPEVDEIDVYGEDYPPTNNLAYEQLGDLLSGTVTRGEGNSCLLIGPSGSGKTQMVERAIAALPGNPIVVRLSGYAQHNDRLAIREIAWQLAQQTGHSFLPANDEDDDENEENALNPPPVTTLPREDEDENPFADAASTTEPGPSLSVTLPPPAHLLALISMIPTLPRPTIVVLDGFDLFASHARQALLYCLLDTAQACRAGPTTAAAAPGGASASASGMAVVGVTARVDTINLLEKRVKSRFSGRMIRTAGPARMGHWLALTRAVLGAPIEGEGEGEGVGEDAKSKALRKEWGSVWAKAVDNFMENDAGMEALRETYALMRDYQTLRRILTSLALELTLSSPYPTPKSLKSAIGRQRCPSRFPALNTLPYPAVCLLIAAVHAQTSGHDVFTFEMLHETFKNQVRTSQSAPVHIEGGGIGMVRCSRDVLFAAFERLADLRIFQPAAAPSATVGREFALYRSSVDRFAVKKAVEAIGQLNLKKWFTKAQ
ncbi:origin recognition complex subunit 4 C-terminus-domain-containing protein [Trametes maxima]|nr:origin recognition complex subunit 4 C-terminus-domain-containing protein [Trametes maxima]